MIITTPCEIGDKVYFLYLIPRLQKYEIAYCECIGFEISINGTLIKFEDKKGYTYCCNSFEYSDTVFESERDAKEQLEFYNEVSTWV